MKNLFPVFINLENKKCLVAGFGEVGIRKTGNLLPCHPALILVADPCPPEKLPEKGRQMIQPPVHYECRKWRDTDLDNCFMAFACTNDPGANRELANACAKKNILCNCAAPPDAGNCIIPARARKGVLEAAISTAGASPLLAAKLRDEMKNMLAHYAEMAKFMALLRPEILKVSQNSAENKVFFAKIASSPFSVWLAGHDYNRCREWLKKNVFVLSTTQIDNIFIKLMS